MSKIGMKPVLVNKAKVFIENSNLLKIEQGSHSLNHVLPNFLIAELEGNKLHIKIKEHFDLQKNSKALWGLHRALVANKIKGVEEGFVSQIRMVGLAYKTAVVGNNLVFSLGYSHKIELPLEKDIVVEIDKTGQLLTLKSFDKEKLGLYCAKIRQFRKPEPYKGTGIFVNNETIIRKVGKRSKS